MYNSCKKILLRTVLFIFLSSTIATRLISNSIVQEEIPLDTHIANSYVQATFGPVKPTKPQEPKKQNLFNIPPLEKKTITQREEQEIAFNIIRAHEQSFPTDVTIDKTFIDKIELVAGGQKSEEHLVSKLFNHMHTALGKAWSSLQLTKPTTDVNQIQRRQEAIQLLLDNPQLLDKLDTLLAELKKTEHQLLTFWHPQPPVNPALLRFVYFNQWFDRLNTNTAILEISNKLVDLISISFGTVGMPASMVFNIKNQSNCSFWQATKIVGSIYLNLFKNNAIPLEQKVVFSLSIPYQGLITYLIAANLKNKINIGKHLQGTLIGTASYLHNAKNIKQVIKHNKELLQVVPTLEHLIDLDDNNHHSAQFIKLLSMLETNTFKGNPSSFSITGRILAAHKLMTIVKDELTATLNAIAELDTYVALAKLYKNQDDAAPYSFVEFRKSESPSLQAINFWNPFIDPKTVVTNTIELGQHNRQNVILTGPNTGGKSTVIKALLINMLLAQTFGIAAAEKFEMTPFKKLNCYLNITDDIAAGVSLFKAEVLRAKELITTLRTLPPHDFCFTIIDEAFSGTSPQEGEYASYKFAEQLGDFNNGITLIATHYPKLIDLEQEKSGTYKNYHVEVIRREDGSLNRTFKLLAEPSRMNIALDILAEEGVL